MDLRAMTRMTAVGVMTGALLLGALGGTGGAASNTLPTYSDDDCSTLTNIQVDNDTAGYYGKAALNASEAFKGAAVDIESKKLRKSMNTLAGVWKVVGETKNPIAAAKAIGRVGNRYPKALGVYTKALVSCSNQSMTATTTTTDDTSSSDGSSSDGSSTDDGSSTADSSE